LTNLRFPRRILAFTEIHVQGATKPREIRGKSLEVTVDLQEQKIMDMEAIMRLCIQTEENYPGFRKFGFFQLVDATDGFSENRNVGIGGFGTVYKVMNVRYSLSTQNMICYNRMLHEFYCRASYLMDIQLLSKDLLWMQQYLISKVNCSL
jgi:hypothetical protein